ncbi:hypothetical protein N1495_00735 [Streptococcus didelphis]|uniref:Uncharacterized protein n=1 Tax=Streptococcus didelphis TaxID=102886 RepID=A0ABY9LG87_9STRE|nr:hypothetical protein [Streptococcus didelphis]WMB27920.1 hypothetical protein N1496_07830 [Streptococcus didelphis]WMB29611.1 hypothetical protein N1495_00735 [Streptococcus didelphis]
MKKVKINGIKWMMIAVLSLISLAGFSPILAQEGQAQVPDSKVNVERSTIEVNSKLQKDSSILDVSIDLGTTFKMASQVAIQLQDSKGQTLATIDYNLVAGAKTMTAWFDLKGRPTDDYKVKVVVNDSKNRQETTISDIHYQAL